MTSAPAPALVLVAHGTSRAGARSVVGTVVAGVRDVLPGVDVRLAHVDVQPPGPAEVLAEIHAAGRRAVVVPLLLSAGFHVEVDIAGAVDASRDVVTPTLAGAPELVAIGWERVLDAAAGAGHLDALVVVATGSSRAGAREQVVRYAADIATASGLPTSVAWAAGGEPDVATAVTDARPGRVGVVSYLLAPGVFASRAREAARAAGAIAVGTPLGPDPRLAAVVARRFRAALRESPPTSR